MCYDEIDPLDEPISDEEMEFLLYLGDQLDAAHDILDQAEGDMVKAAAIEAVSALTTVKEGERLLESESDEFNDGLLEGLSRAGLALRALVQAYLSRTDDAPLTIKELLNDTDDI